MSLTPVSFKKPVVAQPRLSPVPVIGKLHKRFWSEDECAIIRKYYPTGGAIACMAHLPGHRTVSGVYGQAHKMGLAHKQAAGQQKRYPSTPEMDERIKAEWPLLNGKKRGEVQELADRLEVPRWWLSGRARQLKLTMPHRKEPRWTAAEDALMLKVPLHDPDKCGDIFRQHGFRRSPTAIVIRSKRLSLSRRATREEWSATKAAAMLGVDGKTVTRWIIDGELKATKRIDKRLTQQGGSSWDITPADLRQFIIDRLERVDFRKVANPDLFPDMISMAVISRDHLYRYELRRIWDHGKPLLVVCMLNPSKADAEINDPTILALIHFGKLWGYGGLLVVNLRAFRSSKPSEMYNAPDPNGPENHDYIRAALRYASEHAKRALVAWGNASVPADSFLREAEVWGIDLICLGTTLGGQPKHPMARGHHRIPRDQMPVLWKVAA